MTNEGGYENFQEGLKTVFKGLGIQFSVGRTIHIPSHEYFQFYELMTLSYICYVFI